MNRAQERVHAETWADPYGDLFRAWASVASEMLAISGPRAPAPARGDQRGAGSHRQVIELVAQAHLASSSAFLRCCDRAARSWGEYGQAAAASASPAALSDGVDVGALAKLVDEARAHVRRLGEIALDESRLLSAQMEALGERLRAMVDDPAPQRAPRRYARAKR